MEIGEQTVVNPVKKILKLEFNRYVRRKVHPGGLEYVGGGRGTAEV